MKMRVLLTVSLCFVVLGASSVLAETQVQAQAAKTISDTAENVNPSTAKADLMTESKTEQKTENKKECNCAQDIKTEDIKKEEVQKPARPFTREWWWYGEFGSILSPFDSHLGDEWTHKSTESFAINTGVLRYNQRPGKRFFYLWGLSAIYTSSREQLKSAFAESELTDRRFGIYPELRFGLDFYVKGLESRWSVFFVGAVGLSFADSASVKINSKGFSRELKEASKEAENLSHYGFGLMLKEMEPVKWMLIWRRLEAGEILSLGVAYEF